MNFSHETKVKDIAATGTAATRILENAGVDYCCAGHQSLSEACVKAGVSPEEIMERLRAASTQVNPADINWLSAPLSELTLHIRTTHHHYVRQAIEDIRNLLARVEAKHGQNHPEIAQIEELFSALSQEMILHLRKEEQILFPYIDALERSAHGHDALEPPFFQTVQNPIQAMMREHDAAADLVRQIRTASSDYALPADACATYQALYRELCNFEADLHQHVHLENNILFPRAATLEADLT